MLAYSLRRLGGAIPTLFVVMTVSFFMMRLAPGGPFDRERMLAPAVEANIKKAYNLDQPLVVQYGLYLSKALKGDLGPSFKYQDYTVVELISSGFPVSFEIGIAAIVLAVIAGGGLGIFAALRQNSGVDHAVMATAMIGITVPNFVMAPVMTLILGVYLQLLPVVSYLGPAIAGIITGSVVIETIFGIPGIGRYFVQGALNRDYTLVMGVVMFYGALIILLNLLVDLAYGLLDPKIRYD